jgi:putative nucleotidyltransferase with HDIG domain
VTGGPRPRGGRHIAARLAVRRGEFVQLRRRLLSQTWLWMLVFVAGSLVLVGSWKVRTYPQLVAGDIAPHDIVVDRDTTLPDVESTEQKKQRASLEVLPVYIYDKSVEDDVESKLQRGFAVGLGDRRSNLKDLATQLSDTVGVTIPTSEAAVLRRARFNADLLATLREVVSRMYNQGIVADRAELLQSGDRGISLRYAGTDTERVELDVYKFLDGTPTALTETVEGKLASDSSIPRSWRTPLTSFLVRLLRPNVVFDRGETLARRLKAAAQVEEVSIRLPRGRVLVRRGDEITPQMARLLAGLSVRSASSRNTATLVGTSLIAVLLALTWFFYLKRDASSREDFRNRFGGVVILTMVSLAVEHGFSFLAGSVAASMMRDPFGNVDIYLPVLPHAAGPILAGLMFGLPVAIFFSMVQGVLVSLMVGGGVSLAVYALIGGTAAAFASQRLKDRNVLARAGLLVAGVNVTAIIALALWQGKVSDGTVLAAQAGAAMLGGLVAAALASFLLPVLESLTGTVTDIRLLELSNPNLPLLKRLALEAPGTFQHSLAMANLAEAAAEAIGANPLLARVCCYYHDIGKLGKPVYFVENQRGDNPHDNLTPWMSALVVSNHVKHGLELARKYRLPEPIREAITSHHGTKLIRYFYSRAKEREDEDHGEVQESEFRYPGPRPRSKEMGILLLADAAEAAGRTLQNPTPGKIQGMIDQIFKNVLEDGQLDDCDLTLKDLEKIGAAFQWVMTNAFHQRIDYPGFEFNGRARRGA